MLHRTAKLTPSGRRLLVDRILIEGWPPATAAEMLGVSRATAYKWIRRYRAEGPGGLEDRSARPRRRPRALTERQVRRILLARRRLRVGPHRLGPLLGHPRSTVYGVLRRNGVSRLAHADRATGIPVRYVRERPGELVHIDVKRLGRVPDGGGHRMLGDVARHRRPVGYDYLHVAIDDATRVAYVAVRPDERAASTISFVREAVQFFADQGAHVERVMTDNAWTYVQSPRLAALFAELGGVTCAPGHVGRRPTARPSASSAPSSMRGPAPGCSDQTTSAWRRCPPGSMPRIDDVPTPGYN